MSLRLQQGDLKKLSRNLNRTLKDIRLKRDRIRILKAGAEPVIEKAKTLVPRGKKIRKRITSSGATATYFPGNLRKSLQHIPNKKLKNAVLVGPRYNRKKAVAGGKFGKTKRNVDAYYAHMVYGSAKAFGRKVTQKALRSRRTQAIRAIRAKLREEIRKKGRKLFVR